FFSSRRRHTRWPRDWTSDVCSSDLVFTENETNPRVFDGPAGEGYYKDAFHRYVVEGDRSAAARDAGTKTAAVYAIDVPAGGEAKIGRASCRERRRGQGGTGGR